MQNIERLRAMIKSIPATPEGNRQIAMMANDPDPMKRMLAGIEANERARVRAQKQAVQGQQQQGRRPVVQEKMDELMQAGIGGLDVGEDMYGQGMAAGGIVAFDQGGGVNTEDPLMQFSGLDAEGMSADQARFEALMEQRRLKEARDRFNFLKNAAPDTAAAMLKNNPALAERPPVAANPAAPAANPAANPAKPNAKPPAAAPAAANPNQPPAQQDPFSIMQAYLKGDAAERAAARKEAKDMALLETGLAMLGGDSPYAGVNIGRAGAQGARGYGERIAGLRKEERDVGKSLADLELKKYELAQARDLGELQRKTQKEVAGIYASARGDSGDKLEANIRQKVSANIDKNLLANREYGKLKTQAEKDAFRRRLIDAEMATYGFKGGAAGKSWEGWSGGPQG